MMMNLSCEVLKCLQGKTLVTAESCTGGGIGAALTAVPGSSDVFKGGVISYTNDVKADILQVERALLNRVGAVSAPVAEAMAEGARKLLSADIAVSVTGLAGPGADAFGNPVGTVFIGYADDFGVTSEEYHFDGNRDIVRQKTIDAALRLVLNMQK